MVGVPREHVSDSVQNTKKTPIAHVLAVSHLGHHMEVEFLKYVLLSLVYK